MENICQPILADKLCTYIAGRCSDNLTFPCSLFSAVRSCTKLETLRLKFKPQAGKGHSVLFASQLGDLPRSLQELTCNSFAVVATRDWNLSGLTNLTRLDLDLHCDREQNYTQVNIISSK